MYRQKRTELRDGDIIMVEKGYAPRIGKKGGRGQIISVTSEKQKEINANRASRNRINLIINNFNWRYELGKVTYRGDHWITLTYKKDMRPADIDSAHKIFTKLLQFIKRKHPEVKYMGKTELPPSGNVHHHLIISRHEINGHDVILDLIKNKWFKYSANVKCEEIYSLLDEQLANYFIKCEHSHKCDKCKYTQSLNLKKPVVKVKILKPKTFRKEPKAIKGYEIVSVNNYQDYFGFDAQRYVMRRIGRRC
ncbi:MAG: hypothetical protein ACI4EA_04570 [Candidatus Ornithomonoglobus sp.]